MNILPFPLDFSFRFNLHKLTGFQVEDDDIRGLAPVYAAKYRTLKSIDADIQRQVTESAENIAGEHPFTSAGGTATIMFIGDSITSDRLSYAKMINAVLSNRSAGTIIDAGISGDTTSDLINRIYDSVLNLSFDRAIIMIGTNDARGHNDGTGISNTSPAEFKRNLDYLLGLLAGRNVPAYLITIPPVDNRRMADFFGTEANWHYETETIDEINTVIRQSAQTVKGVCIDFAAAVSESGKDVLDVDGLHLSRAGHEQLASMVMAKLA